MNLSTWLAFFAASWAISLSPGPGAMAAMSAGLTHGWSRGMWVTLGLVLGVWTQIVVVGIGLGAVMATSTVAFTAVKWLGVVYLVWLGIQQWRVTAVPLQADASEGTALLKRRDLIARGWMINAVNPKGTAFILAVVPQFLDVAQSLAWQYVVIAATLGFTDLVVMAGYTALASKVLALLRSPQQIRWLNRSFGAMFVGAGVWLATFKRAA
jgi:homoserine/homoserine lactone efflux protein